MDNSNKLTIYGQESQFSSTQSNSHALDKLLARTENSLKLDRYGQQSQIS